VEHGFLDRHSGLSSPVHRLDARVKALIMLGFVLAVVSTPARHLLAFVIYAGLMSWAAALSRVPPGFLLSRAALVLPFSALVALGLPFMPGGERLAVLGGRMHLSVEGLWMLAGVTMQSFLSALAGMLLVSTTPFSSLLTGLRRLGLPALLADLLALTYRYIFVLVGEAMRLKRAAVARGYRPRWLPQAVIVGRLAGSLYVRSYERAERIYGAMRLRGYDGRMPAERAAHFRLTDGLVLALAAAGLTAVRLLAP